MNEWDAFQANEKKIKVKAKLSRVIILELGQCMEEFFMYDKKIRPQRTRLIKDKLALLGHHRFKYKVYANGLSPHHTQLNGGTFKNAEWLYDLHWYVEGKDKYTTVRLPLVMECEWQQKRKGDRIVPFSGIKYDFQKLLVANAEFRLMIFKIEKATDFEALEIYFENNINNYKHLPKDAAFLFIGFHDKKKALYYREIFKQ